MKRWFFIFVVLLLLITPALAATQLSENKLTKTDKVSAKVSNGESQFSDGKATVSSKVILDGKQFTPNGTTQIEKGVKYSGVATLVYELSDTKLKETVTIYKKTSVSFPLTISPGFTLISWYDGEYKIVESSMVNTASGIVIEKPFGIDADGVTIPMSYTQQGNTLILNYPDSINVYDLKSKPGNPKYNTHIVKYPLAIDPSFVAYTDHYLLDLGSGTFVEKFNTTGWTNFTPPSGITQVTFLIVGGGGAAGGPDAVSAGGGGGGVQYGTAAVTPGVNVTVAVGYGGNVTGATDGQGGPSIFGSQTVTGGGWGATYLNAGGTGGSGGGGGAGEGAGTAGAGGANVTGQGFYGGNGADRNGPAGYSAGGGGGAGAQGDAAVEVTEHGGNGGIGLNFSVQFGTLEFGDNGMVAGGGGGTGDTTAGTGGLGGGGNGGHGGAGTAGTPGTGGGAGGSRDATVRSGGSGLVLVKYTYPSASFTYTPSSGISPLTVHFTDTSTGAISMWNWSFQENATSVVWYNTTVATNPTYTFPYGGTNTSYTHFANLSVNNNFTAAATYSQQVTVWGNITPAFTASPTAANIGTLIVFTDASVVQDPTGLTYNWSFGDGMYSNTIGSVNHVYSTFGIYDVTLNITNWNNASSLTKTSYIAISTQTLSSWYSPKQVEYKVLNSNGVPQIGLKINSTFNVTTFPDPNWLSNMYGVPAQVAAQMENANLSATGFTKNDGALTFTQHSSLQYDITITGTDSSGFAVLFNTTVQPYDGQYTFWLRPRPITNATDWAATALNATLTYSEPDIYNSTFGVQYQDQTGNTQLLEFTLKDHTNGTIVYFRSGVPGTGAVWWNTTVPNRRGLIYDWYYNAVRLTG